VDFDVHTRMCSFCGGRGSTDRRLVGGLGAMICVTCVEDFHALSHPPTPQPDQQPDQQPPWAAMSEAELLASLPLIMRTADQVDRFAAEWVGLIRERGVSWAAIGQALGVSRLAAWERFSKRITSDAAG
jgi:hypothetical protein